MNFKFMGCIFGVIGGTTLATWLSGTYPSCLSLPDVASASTLLKIIRAHALHSYSTV